MPIKINHLIKRLYFLSLLLFLLPSFNLRLTYSYGIGKLLLCFITFLIVILILKKKITLNLNNKLALLFSLFFITQGLSIINAVDISLYVSRFKDLIFLSLFFFCSMYVFQYRENNKKLIIVLVIGLLFDLFSQVLMFFYPKIFIEIANNILYPGDAQLISLNIDRQRVYLGTYDEIMIPVIIYFHSLNKRKILLPLLPIIVGISFLSQFRTKLLMAVFSFLSSLAILSKGVGKNNFIKVSILPISLVIIILFSAYFLSSITFGNSIINRLLLQNKIEDVLTVEQRISKSEEAISIGLSAPVFGVGLGNYNYYVTQRQIPRYNVSYQQIQIDLLHPHSLIPFIFAETGLPGLMAFILLVIYFITEDTKTIRYQKNNFTKALIISFWTLFLYSLFNPTTNFSYNVLFWLLRVVIYYESVNRWTHDRF